MKRGLYKCLSFFDCQVKFRATVHATRAAVAVRMAAGEFSAAYRRGNLRREEAAHSISPSTGVEQSMNALALHAPAMSPCSSAWSMRWLPHPGQSYPVMAWNAHFGAHCDVAGLKMK